MIYNVKYILSFYSDRGNDYTIRILKKGYEGNAVNKKLGSSPVLNIEDSDGAIKGSSLAFAIQADAEGELRELYTTDNKEFRVQLYRNGALYWQGYLLPELYSENYIDPPYDVAVTATDQLAVLKDIAYDQPSGMTTLLDIIRYILYKTAIDLPIKEHVGIKANGLPLLENTYVDTDAYKDQTCYDVLNGLLLSCNASIQQLAHEWLILSLTDTSTTYIGENGNEVISHAELGQLGVTQLCPSGSMTLVNQPAYKGVKLNYSHALRNSFLKNANCESTDYWQWTLSNSDCFPREVDNYTIKYKLNCWSLPQVSVRYNNALQIWQDVDVVADPNYNCQLSVDYLMGPQAQILLLAVIHEGVDGKRRRLTSEGWVDSVSSVNTKDYINITGTPSEFYIYTWDAADLSKYETATVKFALPPVNGTLRIGFINSCEEQNEPYQYAYTYVTKVYLTYLSINGKTSTTIVEANATNAQEEVSILYGDKTETQNDKIASLNTLRDKDGNPISSFVLVNSEEQKTYDSYFLVMLQELSRYYGSKKMRLQGSVMGDNILFPLYKDVFSGKVLRLLNAGYDLVQDEASVVMEELPESFVEYETEVFATENKFSVSSSTGVATSGGANIGGGTAGESFLMLRANGDVYVKNDKTLAGVEADFEQQAVPRTAPAEAKEGKTYVYAGGEGTAQDVSDQQINLGLMARKVNKLWDFWSYDEEINAVKTRYNVLVEGTMAMKKLGPGGSGGGGGTASGSIRVYLGDVAYDSKNGVVNLPAYPSLAGYATESWVNNKGYLTAVTWDIVSGKPSFATVATSGKYSDLSGLPTIPTNNNQLTNGAGYITSAALNGYATESWVGANYLGLSGGTISSGGFSPLTIKGSSSYAGLGLKIGDRDAAYLVHEGGQDWFLTDEGWYNRYFIVHSGNIGSYNAGSATKLQTARNIWGQSFDGSANVSGDLNLNVSKIYWHQDSKNYCIYSYYDGSTTYLNIKDYGNILFHTSVTERMRITNGGNVLIGTTSDNGAKLQVNGDIYSNAAITSTSVIRTQFYGTATCGLYPNSWITSDGVNNRLWLYNDNQLALYGSEIQLRNTTKVHGDLTVYRPGSTENLLIYVRDTQVVYQGYDSDGYVYHDFFSNNTHIARFDGYSNCLTVYNFINTQTIYTTNWVRSYNDTGWFNETYGGGIWMCDSNYVRVYNGKGFLCDGEIVSNNRIYVTAERNATSPVDQAIVINSATGASTYAGWPGMGFHIPGITYATIKLGSDTCFHFMNSGLSGWVDVKVGNLTATGGATFGGDVQISGDLAFASDARLKDSITTVTAEESINILRQLRPTTWNWKKDGNRSYGLIAQEVAPILPDMITEGEHLHLQYNHLHAFEIGAIQNVDNRVEQLERKVAVLENELKLYRRVM